LDGDSILIAGILAGESATIRRVRLWIRESASGYVNQLADDLEDIEQEVLLDLTVALRAGRFHGKCTLRTYVRTFVHHDCIDRIRRARRRLSVSIEEVELVSPAPSALEDMLGAEDAAIARRVLEQMPEGCRRLWRMVLAGLHYREMSLQLGVPEGRLRVQVLRCRRRAWALRERLLEPGCNEADGSTTI